MQIPQVCKHKYYYLYWKIYCPLIIKACLSNRIIGCSDLGLFSKESVSIKILESTSNVIKLFRLQMTKIYK